VPVMLLRRSPQIHIETPAIQNQKPLNRPGLAFKNDKTWLEPAWISLWNRYTNTATSDSTPTNNSMLARAEYICNLVSPTGKFRHLMEIWSPDRRAPDSKRRIPCPMQPAHERNNDLSNLSAAIMCAHQENPQLARDAVEIFLNHLEKGEFVRMASIADAARADRYIEFLRALGLKKRQIQLVSGATKSTPEFKSEWKSLLAESNLIIGFADESRNFGRQTSLSIRPSAGVDGGTGAGHTGFRFAMLMAFIVFGPDLNVYPA